MERKADWTQECWWQEDNQTTPSQHPLLPPAGSLQHCYHVAEARRSRGGSKLWELRVTPALPCLAGLTPARSTEQEVFLIKRDKDYTPDSKASLSSHFPVFCLGFTGLLQLFWDIKTSDLFWVWKGLMFFYVGVFSSLEEEKPASRSQ